MYNTESNPILINCIFKGNSSVDEHCGYGRGGGMYNVYSNPTLFNCIFTRNDACGGCTGVYGGRGGGMYFDRDDADYLRVPLSAGQVFSASAMPTMV